MWHTLYQVLLLVAWPWVYLRLRWRARREPEYGERIRERFGCAPSSVRTGPVWFHTVSAGETIAAAPLVERFAARYLTVNVLVTTMTPAGSSQVRSRLGDRVDHCYAPYDFPWAVRRFYRRVRPRLVVLMETELWPNLIAEAARRGVPVLLVNARLSERSARGYSHAGRLVSDMLNRIQTIACQYPDHARRFIELGAAPERVVVHGSVKFDLELPDDHAERAAGLVARWGLNGRPVWIAASTHPGEEAMVLAAHEQVRRELPDARLVLVPRHPARADEVADLCRRAGFAVSRQSAPGRMDREADVLLGDRMGELVYLYGLAAAAFVGGSLVSSGGHNPIEPAVCGIPVAMGPHLHNFLEVAAIFRAQGCLIVVENSRTLAHQIVAWLSSPEQQRALGQRAASVVEQHRGATERLESLLAQAVDGLARHGDG